MNVDYVKNTKSNKHITHLGIYFIGALLLNGLSFLTTPIYTRILPIDDFGVVTIFRTWVMFFSTFIGLQVVGSIATARVHKSEKDFEVYMKNITMLSLFGFLILSLIVILFKFQIGKILNLDSTLVFHLLIQSYGTACVNLFTVYTIQTRKPKQNVIFSILFAFFSTLISIMIILSLSNDMYMGKIYGYTIAYTIIIIFVLFRFLLITGKFRISDWKYSLLLGTPLILHLMSNILISQSDRIFLERIIGQTAVAIYSVSYTIATIGLILSEITNKIWSPWYLDQTKAGETKKINSVSLLYVKLISIIFISLSLVSNEILVLMAPIEYQSGISSLLIIVFAIFFQFLYRFPLGFEQYCKNMKWVALNTLIATGVNISINFILISRIGILGAAISTLVSYIILFLLHEFVARNIIKGYNIEFRNYIFGIFGVGSIAILSYIFINLWPVRYFCLVLIWCISIYHFLKNKKNSSRGGFIND
ncbi:lipopolysaccharide biosynthesis protein [Peloplasma aerotolerans]|uniref:Oligosaccharide flippase family protein n=1 Tax=Peloplasma aerotolerans TaxID=3044389 RepID=A0AAW6U3D4_9MOLU|nr:oligosaccharide flippase family protein [Mariniplasma sp. M4Ah]MDI6452385.1 oligosaccharide flippase family protein [Mariniplasma sp. M4Ah]